MCIFAYTNGTLVDEELCRQMQEVGNLFLAISLEGKPEVNDLRRGKGVYGKVMHAMDLLKEHGLVFGTSICYTSQNIESVTSDEFIKMIIEKGCRYSLYFHYMPVGNEASVDLLPAKEQRLYMHDRVREIRNMKTGPGILLWISKMMGNTSADVLREAGITSISMQTGTRSHACLSIIPMETSGKTRFWKY